MKKVLFASTALVAAGLMTASAASASEKIKLNLGGYSKWWVVGAWQEDSYQSTAATSGGRDFNTVDVKGDNEIYFGGSTTLDNGMKVGVQIEMEAGGHTDQGSDVIDESYVFVETGFGKFIVGSENNGTYLLHVSAPDAAGNWGEGSLVGSNAVFSVPASVSALSGGHTTAIATDGDAEKITYVAPTFYGLTVGGSYVPTVAAEDNRGAQTATEIYGVGALYANTFGGVGVKLSGGWVTYDAASASNSNSTEWSSGLQLSYAGFTLGGSYKEINNGLDTRANGANNVNFTTTSASTEGNAWDVGLSYASGPYSVSVAYYDESAEGLLRTSGEDTFKWVQVSGKYTLGAGVDVLASIAHVDIEDESSVNTAANPIANRQNEGWAVMTGLGLAF